MPWLRHFTIFALEERARALVHEIAHIVGGPLRGPYDFGQDAMLQELVALKRRTVMDLLRMRPPPVRRCCSIRRLRAGAQSAGIEGGDGFSAAFARAVGELGVLPEGDR